jgi:hypothetical protein
MVRCRHADISPPASSAIIAIILPPLAPFYLAWLILPLASLIFSCHLLSQIFSFSFHFR